MRNKLLLGFSEHKAQNSLHRQIVNLGVIKKAEFYAEIKLCKKFPVGIKSIH
jgi:hypothetical protein